MSRFCLLPSFILINGILLLLELCFWRKSRGWLFWIFRWIFLLDRWSFRSSHQLVVKILMSTTWYIQTSKTYLIWMRNEALRLVTRWPRNGFCRTSANSSKCSINMYIVPSLFKGLWERYRAWLLARLGECGHFFLWIFHVFIYLFLTKCLNEKRSCRLSSLTSHFRDLREISVNVCTWCNS